MCSVHSRGSKKYLELWRKSENVPALIDIEDRINKLKLNLYAYLLAK